MCSPCALAAVLDSQVSMTAQHPTPGLPIPVPQLQMPMSVVSPRAGTTPQLHLHLRNTSTTSPRQDRKRRITLGNPNTRRPHTILLLPVASPLLSGSVDASVDASMTLGPIHHPPCCSPAHSSLALPHGSSRPPLAPPPPPHRYPPTIFTHPPTIVHPPLMALVYAMC